MTVLMLMLMLVTLFVVPLFLMCMISASIRGSTHLIAQLLSLVEVARGASLQTARVGVAQPWCTAVADGLRGVVWSA